MTATSTATPPAGGQARSPTADRDLVVAELDVLRALVTGQDPAPARDRLERLRARSPGASRLDEVAVAFDLSSFERATLLLAYGPDLVGDVGRELAERTGQPFLTFAAALAILPDPHWDALTHTAPLRAWSLLRPQDPTALLATPLLPDERVVHHLVGVETSDERLDGLSRPLEAPPDLPPTHAAVAAEVVRRWAADGLVVLRGPQPRSTREIAAAACATVGLEPRLVAASDLPTSGPELAALVRRMARESVLGRVGWVLDLEQAPPGLVPAVGRVVPTSEVPLVMTVSDRPGGAVAGGLDGLAVPVLRVPRLGAGERSGTYARALRRAGAQVPEQEVAAAAGTFDLALPDVRVAADEVARGVSLWTACRRRPRADVGGLARVRSTTVGWDRLVLPDEQLAQLRALVAAARHRTTVLDAWGFAAASERGRGTAALFAGDSGTGKTFAAEVVAHDLALDLVHVDLSQVVDKYLGETEKRLAQLFDAAEDGGMVLLFDEADALFGKRSEVKDSHDRYANVEVGYLLQRLESFGGLAVLTTNARSALDVAFTRRLSTIVTFPYPDRPARLRMWQQSLPAALPTADLDLGRLAEADLSGGAIAAAALQAAYLAADDGGVLTMSHLAQAVRWELAKNGRVANRGATGPRRQA